MFRNRWKEFLKESEMIRRLMREHRRSLGIGMLAIFVVDIADLYLPLVLRDAVDGAMSVAHSSQLLVLALTFVGVTLIQAAGRYVWRIYIFDAAVRSAHSLRSSLIRKFFRLPPAFFDRTPTGKLMSLATNDIEAVRMAIGSGSVTAVDALFYIFTVPVAMWSLSPKLTLLALIPFPIIPFYVFWAKRRIQIRFERVQADFSQLSAMAQEDLANIRTIKALGIERSQTAKWTHQSYGFLEKNLALSRIQSALGPTLDFIMSTSMVLLIYVGSQSVLKQAITVGTLVAFQRYIQKLIWPMSALAFSVSFYQRGVTSSKRLGEILALPELPESALKPVGPLGPRPCKGGIEFRSLSFSYPDPINGKPSLTLRNLTLKIEPGERVALMGPVGSGKSTLMMLIPGLYPVNRGQLFVDETDICDWPLQELRSHIGFVGQELFLFNETLQQTLDGTRDNPRATMLSNLVSSDPSEWDLQATVGERGSHLSGGQRQRIALARAISLSPAILLLDDAFSNVDTITEEAILGRLQKRAGRGTEIVAAHRLATLRDAHRVIVLEQGSVLQSGTHAHLMKDRSGLYRRFYEQQRLQEEIESAGPRV